MLTPSGTTTRQTPKGPSNNPTRPGKSSETRFNPEGTHYRIQGTRGTASFPVLTIPATKLQAPPLCSVITSCYKCEYMYFYTEACAGSNFVGSKCLIYQSARALSSFTWIHAGQREARQGHGVNVSGDNDNHGSGGGDFSF